ncbi:MAG: isopenicillin N synthase family oxygenase [Proteobacteria bacterium]|nr:isopenicillin N synthase family oxygenase [Pseudomonadota bacterium]
MKRASACATTASSAGAPGAAAQLARELTWASEHVGFYFIVDHGIAQSQIDTVFAEAARFHAQPLEAKLALKINLHQIGYLPIGGVIYKTSQVNRNTKSDLNEAFFVRRDRAPGDPVVVAGERWRGLNQWPDGLPGFRAVVTTYQRAIEDLALRLLDLYDLALDTPAGFFRARFEDAHINLRLSHYPPNLEPEDNQFGIAPHTDSGFMTFLPQSIVPGLEIGLPGGRWITPPPMPGTYLVNSGDILNRWTNGRFLSTPHRANNRSKLDRYAAPFFFDPNPATLIECLPSCQGPGNPPRFPAQTFGDYYAWWVRTNYPHQQKAEGA